MGTPTCIVFGKPDKPDENSSVLIAANLPGGGDLHTPPEESPLWHTLAREHEHAGYSDSRVTVSARDRKELARWPWNFDPGPLPTQRLVETNCPDRLTSFLGANVGYDAITAANDIFYLSGDFLRRLDIPPRFSKPLLAGELLRNHQPDLTAFTLWPYDTDSVKPKLDASVRNYLRPFRSFLEIRSQFHKTQLEAGLEWFEFREYHKRALKKQITYADISTHFHAIASPGNSVFNQHAPVIELPSRSHEGAWSIILSLLNCSSSLFWLKQVCFSKRESEEGARDTYFEFAGGKVQQLPVPPPIADFLRSKPTPLTDNFAVSAKRCSELGRQLLALALRKLFEKHGEAYDGWNTSLTGYTSPAAECHPPFGSFESLRRTLKNIIAERENRRAEMIGLQEEMDWLCYQAYGLASGHSQIKVKTLHLSENERPFRLWAKAGGDFGGAIALIPENWSTQRKKIWQDRLAIIRDNEHVRRIEAPMYKRRWDEQWKVGNRWMSGPVAYAQEFIDAFIWWLAEKAEWHLEHKAGGGPIALGAWTVALWKDVRVAAAWPVVAESLNAIESWKASAKDKTLDQPTAADHSSFAKFFRETIDAETVPNGIPPGTSWENLEKKGIKASAQTKRVRGKLNVPRERFRRKTDGTYIWAGKV